MFIDLKKTLFVLATAPLALGACSDPEPSVDAAPDPADATVAIDADTTDAMPDTSFLGTVSLAEVAISNNLGEGVVVAGSVINVSFTNPADITKAPEPGYTENFNACRIFVYDVAGGEAPPTGSDGGDVTIAGTAASMLPAFGCAYNQTVDTYLCSSADTAASGPLPVGTVLTPMGGGVVSLLVPGADFSGENYRGMNIILDGFVGNDVAANGRFPIVGQPATDTLLIFNTTLLAPTTALTTALAYQTLIGAGPIIGGFDGLPDLGGFDFLDDGTADVTITKAAITDVPEIDNMLTANGDGFMLATASAQPHMLPTDGSLAKFDCAGTGGSCGVATGAPLKGIVVFGSTTDGDISDLGPTTMPAPVSRYATFQCSGIFATDITLNAGAMALLLGTGATRATRIQTSVTYAHAETPGQNSILLSHGVVGFTDVPADDE